MLRNKLTVVEWTIYYRKKGATKIVYTHTPNKKPLKKGPYEYGAVCPTNLPTTCEFKLSKFQIMSLLGRSSRSVSTNSMCIQYTLGSITNDCFKTGSSRSV